MFKLLYPALKNIVKKWSMPIKNWKAALNQFCIKNAELLKSMKTISSFSK